MATAKPKKNEVLPNALAIPFVAIVYTEGDKKDDFNSTPGRVVYFSTIPTAGSRVVIDNKSYSVETGLAAVSSRGKVSPSEFRAVDHNGATIYAAVLHLIPTP